jgi:acyl-CoA synthetase (AMP-forming)/AMP-acid ligase II
VTERPGQHQDPGNRTLAALLSARASERPAHPFVSFPGEDLSYGELHDRATALARGLIATGLQPGGHAGILMTNCVAYLELFFAIHLAGGVPVPFNARSATKIQKFRLRELLLRCHEASVRAPNDVRCHPSGCVARADGPVRPVWRLA